jgi:transcriptional regulator GlxA family with amidase domain
MTEFTDTLNVTLVATPDAQVSPLSGLFETFNSFGLLNGFEAGIPSRPFAVEIVAPESTSMYGASGLPLGATGTYDTIQQTDIVIIPLMMFEGSDWQQGRYQGLVEWLKQMNRYGALLCSACTGVLLLAETGLLNGWEATIHWAFAPTFRRNYPKVRLNPQKVLITAGNQHEFVMTGGVMSWHDLALHLIARFVGPSAAQSMARLLMLEWHAEGQMPYISFSSRLDHDDSVVAQLQKWLHNHYMIENPIEEMAARSGLSTRTIERRFRKATGESPLNYVQGLRISEARRRLERTTMSVEKIGYQVGYENTAFFRRVFKRLTRLTPGNYRRKFQMAGISLPITPHIHSKLTD